MFSFLIDPGFWAALFSVTLVQIALGADTKEIPADGRALRSLALRLGYADSSEGDAGHLLLSDLEEATGHTRARYERLLARPED